MKVLCDESLILQHWVMNVWGDERLILGRGWWMSEVMNVLGDECRTIRCLHLDILMNTFSAIWTIRILWVWYRRGGDGIPLQQRLPLHVLWWKKKTIWYFADEHLPTFTWYLLPGNAWCTWQYLILCRWAPGISGWRTQAVQSGSVGRLMLRRNWQSGCPLCLTLIFKFNS